MLKFTIRGLALALVVAVGAANASVVPAPGEVLPSLMAATSAYSHGQLGDGRSSVRTASADRSSTAGAGTESSGLSTDGNPYAMLAAGLAIMAVMARRRWRNQG